MKSIYIHIITFFIVAICFPIQSNSLEMVLFNIEIKSESDNWADTLVYGIDERATTGVDLNLGEDYDLFGPPPGGLWAILRITDPITFDKTLSYTDLKPIPANRGDSTEYEIKTYQEDTETHFKWDDMRLHVDSAFLEDDFRGLEIIKINMLETTEAVINLHENYIRQFLIRVYYKMSTSVEDEKSEKSQINIYPNPCKDILNIESECIYGYQLVDMLGKVLKSSLTPVNKVNISNLHPGSYFIRFRVQNGQMIIKKFVKY